MKSQLRACLGLLLVVFCHESQATEQNAPTARFAIARYQPPPLDTCGSPRLDPIPTVVRRSVYVPMPDGVRLAVDVFLPQILTDDVRLPAIVTFTRYWRAAEGEGIGEEEQFWISRGYAYVAADLRGTGASYGQWLYPWSEQEKKDIGSLIEWVRTQAWSDGNVGSTGVSYNANTALLAAATNHPAVKAVVPRFIDFDVYTDLAFPGGVSNAFFISDWGKMVHAMDMNQSTPYRSGRVRRVDTDADGSLLALAIADHQKNSPIHELASTFTYRDDVISQLGEISLDIVSAYRLRSEVERSKVPIFGWASWMDGGTAQGLLNRFINWNNAGVTVIGAWSHGGRYDANPFSPVNRTLLPPATVQGMQTACFFDEFTKGRQNGVAERALIYYTLAEDTWKKTTVWPLPGTTMQRFYLADGNALSAIPPAAPSGDDTYTVDFEASTGKRNRWYTQLGDNDVIYEDRAQQDMRLLTYTSGPLATDMEVTGHGVVTLRVASTSTDGNFFVYLEDVAPDGKVTYVTEGMLRALHRNISADEPPYKTLYPYRSFRKKDGEMLQPGKTATLTFQLLPTSVLFRAGHRIRMAIAGADHDTFLRTPSEGNVTIRVFRNQTEVSFIDLPVVPR
jgi:uncharacterized protein